MPNTHRRERGNSFIRDELILLLRNRIRDPRVAGVNIVDVDLTPDRRVARVYVTCYSGEEDLERGMEGLDAAKGFMRRHLSKVLHWPWTPHLEFRVDRSWEHGERVDELLRQLDQERQEHVTDDEPSE